MSTTRGVLRFNAGTVQVLLTQHVDNVTLGSAALELRAGYADGSGEGRNLYHRITAPSPKEAWAALSTWITEQLEKAGGHG